MGYNEVKARDPSGLARNSFGSSFTEIDEAFLVLSIKPRGLSFTEFAFLDLGFD